MTAMKLNYVPKAVKEKGWKGSVTIDLLTYDERMDLSDRATEAQKNDSSVGFMRFLIGFCSPKYLKVDLTRPDGEKAQTVDDLIAGGKACHDILQEVALGQINGFEEGN